jgi:hypothetical protein
MNVSRRGSPAAWVFCVSDERLGSGERGDGEEGATFESSVDKLLGLGSSDGHAVRVAGSHMGGSIISNPRLGCETTT